MSIRTIEIGKNDAGQRTDKFLTKTLHNIPQSLLYKYFRKKCIKINDKKAQPEDILTSGDVLKLFISDEFFGETSVRKKPFFSTSCTLLPEEIAYEDENIMILDKPQGELVHAAMEDEPQNGEQICLVDRFVGYLYHKGEYDPEKEQSFTPSLCNRIDRNTCGLVIAAKNAESLRIMNQKVKNREMTKKYLTVVQGVPQKKTDTLRDFLYKDRQNNRVEIFPTKENAKRALKIRYDDDIKTVITKYTLLETDGTNSLLEVELVTGRTHQIRAHLAFYGYPIVGDGKYGVNHKTKTGEKYQKLCSHSLKFTFTTDAGILSYLDGREFFSRYTFTL